MPVEMIWHSRLGTLHCYPRNGCTLASNFLSFQKAGQGRTAGLPTSPSKNNRSTLPTYNVVKNENCKGMFWISTFCSTLDHSIYHLESQKLTPLRCSGQKTTCWIMITAASVVELPQDSHLRTPPNFVKQYKFPEIHKNHLADANVQEHLMFCITGSSKF